MFYCIQIQLLWFSLCTLSFQFVFIPVSSMSLSKSSEEKKYNQQTNCSLYTIFVFIFYFIIIESFSCFTSFKKCKKIQYDFILLILTVLIGQGILFILKLSDVFPMYGSKFVSLLTKLRNFLGSSDPFGMNDLQKPSCELKTSVNVLSFYL